MDKSLLFKLAEPIKEEIDRRRALINQMVGTLYPSIVWDEIEKLSEQYKTITGESYYGINKNWRDESN